MAKAETEKSVYESKYTSGYITEAQYLAEIMCERLAKNKNMSLPYKFWECDDWKKEFKNQVLAAHSVLKLYPIKLIVKVLTAKPKIYSLRGKFFGDMIELERRKTSNLDKVKEPVITLPVSDSNKTPEFYTEQKRNILEDLD